MSRNSVVLLTNPLQQLNATGDPVRADGWYGQAQHMYTVAIHTSAFIGTVHIEATVVKDPQEADWFQVIEPVVFDEEEYIMWDAGGTKNTVHSFKGNFTYIRARMSRAGVRERPLDDSPAKFYGSVDRILLNM